MKHYLLSSWEICTKSQQFISCQVCESSFLRGR